MLTAAEAFMLDIETFFVADAVADFSLKHHKMAMTYAAERCAVTTTTNQIIRRLTGQEAADDLSFDAIVHQVAEYLQINPNEIPLDENLVYLGLDSIRMMSLAEKWRQQGATVNFVSLQQIQCSCLGGLFFSQKNSHLFQISIICKGGIDPCRSSQSIHSN